MSDEDAVTITFVVIGLLLIAMTIGSALISRSPLSPAMVYLALGAGIGPWGLGLIELDPVRDADLLERLSEVAVIVSLFVCGLKLGVPFRDARWRIPVQLASISMVVTVAAIAALGVLGLGLSLGAAVLLGAILAPTDPVLASEVQLADADDQDRLRFGLTGEGGLNDGTAFPFVMLGLGLLSLHELGRAGGRWLAVDVLWAIGAGLAIGYTLGMVVGKTIVFLRQRHREALGYDEFLALGLIALSYGTALLCHAYGFLAVLAAGLAVRRVGIERGRPDEDRETAPKMMEAIQQFNAQLERYAEIAVVVAVGVALAAVDLDLRVLWFIPVLFLVIRPAAVMAGLIGTRADHTQRGLIAWLGIRGAGSIYYLMYAITHDLDAHTAATLVSITFAVVVASIVVHGISVTPIMNRYRATGRS